MRIKEQSRHELLLSHTEEFSYAVRAASRLLPVIIDTEVVTIYPVPRGGIPSSYLLLAVLIKEHPEKLFYITEKPEGADIIFDDLVDTGHTKAWYEQNYPAAVFETLFPGQTDNWVVFTWEQQNYLHPVKEQ